MFTMFHGLLVGKNEKIADSQQTMKSEYMLLAIWHLYTNNQSSCKENHH